MSINKDEALRAKEIAEGLMKKSDFTGARKLALKAQKMDSTLDNISRMIMVCDVHVAATENMIGNEKDWYGILQVEFPAADETMIKKQYRKLALLLHPDKNKSPGAESAFKLIGEAQRILLDNDKKKLYDIKRKALRKPAAPSYKPKQNAQAQPAPSSYKPHPVPNYHTQPAYGPNGHMRNFFNGLRPENGHPQQNAPQAQPAGFNLGTNFTTTCLFCRTSYTYLRIHINKEVTCQSCNKKFAAVETPYQNVPLAKSTCQTNFSFPQQNMFPGQKTSYEPYKRPENPAPTKAKASVPVPPVFTAENKNGKKKRKAMVKSSESSVSSSETEEDDVATTDTKSSQDLEANRERRRSVRSKRQVSYNENVSDDDVGLGNDNVEEEPEDKKQTQQDHCSTENKNPKKKKKEDQVESSDSDEDLSSAEPNIINCDDPDFNDFDKLRDKSCFQAGQIWALYDDGEEGMPRFYALIKKVTTTPNFSVRYVWLEAEDDQDHETHNMTVSVGKFELGGEEKANDTMVFSHLVESKARNRARKFKVFPKKGETWALYKNWNMELDSPPKYEYEFAEILSDHAEGATVTVGFLSKVEGFSCVFRPLPMEESDTFEIPPQEFCRFSHSIPSFRLTGNEGRGVMEGWYELDPAAMPASVSQNQDNQQSPPSGSA